MVNVIGNVTHVQILNEADRISHNANILRKIILPPVIGKIVGQTGLFSLGMATDLGREHL